MKFRSVPGPAPQDWPHGTRQKYQGNRTTPGCRCANCREANAEYTKERRQRLAPPPPPPEHDPLYDDDPFLESLLP